VFDPTAPNASTRDAWSWFATHRARVGELLAFGAAGRLTILGAGNCNDVDLAQARRAFGEVALVDLDRMALEQATRRQHVDGCTLYAPADVSGSSPCPTVPRRASTVVLSACVLSQIHAVINERESDPRRKAAALAGARARHLALMLELLRPGGLGIVVHDMVSSDTVPELWTTAPERVEELSVALLASGNHLHGGRPDVMSAALRGTPGIDRLARAHPWIWQLSATRAYLVHAHVFRKRV
jgi:hypothetical protein